MRFRTADLCAHGWEPGQTMFVPDWCGCTAEYVPVPAHGGWWDMVPIWDPAQTTDPLRRFTHPEPR